MADKPPPRKKVAVTIYHFFQRQDTSAGADPDPAITDDVAVSETRQPATGLSEELDDPLDVGLQPATCGETNQHTVSESSLWDDQLVLSSVGPYDFGVLAEKSARRPFSDREKHLILQNMDQPGPTYKFPSTSDGCQIRRFQSSWFSKFPWLTYSRSQNGAFCSYCFLFACGGSLGAFVQTPYTKFRKALDAFAFHEKKEYHKTAYTKAVAFLECMSEQRESIAVQLSSMHAAQIQRNRQILKSIMATVEVCARQGIALRGHRDDSKHIDNPESNPGNFQALLKFRCEAGDTTLTEHFIECARNATYRSKTIQNDILEILGSMVTEKILVEVSTAKFFAIISDEVQDAAAIEQITFVLRYVHNAEDVCVVNEKFVGFKEQHREMTGEAVASTILKKLKNLGLNCDFLRGQGYDGSGSMAGVRKGASSIILKQYPLAIYVHCCSHILNLSIASSCSDPLVRNMMGTVS